MKFFDFLKSLFATDTTETLADAQKKAQVKVNEENGVITAETTNFYEGQVDGRHSVKIDNAITATSMNWAGLNEPNTSVLRITGTAAELSANGSAIQTFIGATNERASVLLHSAGTDSMKDYTAKLGYFTKDNDDLTNGFYADKDQVGYYEANKFHTFNEFTDEINECKTKLMLLQDTNFAALDTMLPVPDSDTYKAEIPFKTNQTLVLDFSYAVAHAMEAGKVAITAVTKSGKAQTLYEAVSTDDWNAVVGGKLVVCKTKAGYYTASTVANNAVRFETVTDEIKAIKIKVDLGGPGQIQGYGIYKFI